MFIAMAALAVTGVGLLIAAPWIGRKVARPDRDPTAIVRVLQIVAAAFLIGALFARPYNPETAAIAPPPKVEPR